MTRATRRITNWLALFTATVMLAGCGVSRLVEPGVTSANGGIVIDTPIAWSRFVFPRYEIWTIDGIPLNKLYIVPSVKSGEHVLLERRVSANQPDAPAFRAGMRAEEIRDIVLDALTESGAVNIQSAGLRPARFGAADGLRFEFQASTAAGLQYRGMVLAAARGDQLTFLLWMAPAEYYYDRDRTAVDSMLDHASFTN
ncbi:MAG TPA: hypothetical protein VK660_05415 [Xanthomonadaceae bacterium]|nr:hypothetical protein [Xanthomonadaceae bacterium]